MLASAAGGRNRVATWQAPSATPHPPLKPLIVHTLVVIRAFGEDILNKSVVFITILIMSIQCLNAIKINKVKVWNLPIIRILVIY